MYTLIKSDSYKNYESVGNFVGIPTVNISLWIFTNIHKVKLDGGLGTTNSILSHPNQGWVIPGVCILQNWLPLSWLTPEIPLWSQSASPASSEAEEA